MAQRLTIQYDKKPCYDIVFSQSFEGLGEELAELNLSGPCLAERKICILTDSTVETLYAQAVLGQLEGKCKKAVVFSFPAGEKSKTLDTVKEAYTFLIREGFDRKDLLLALGGGVVGDLTGFTAATYLRGVDFIQIPTTLLAQADSSIGGKTGVDFDGYKNMVGAFYMPKLVYMNVSVLKTLEERQYFSGFAEIMKHGLIKDHIFYTWLLDNMYEICERDPAVLEEMVMKSSTIKKMVVEKDPTEKGDRALLNFGHTIGHAIEKLSDFTLHHGECVALGIAGAAYISCQLGNLSGQQAGEIEHILESYGLPTSLKEFPYTPKEILAATKLDKKMEHGKIKFIVLKTPGEAYITKELSDEEILAGITHILEE